MIHELPPWKLRELREKLRTLRQQIDSSVMEYQETVTMLRRAGYYEWEWINLETNFNHPLYERSELFNGRPDVTEALRLRYTDRPRPQAARKAWDRFTGLFGRPPAALYWPAYGTLGSGWVAEYPREGRASLYVDANLRQIY